MHFILECGLNHLSLLRSIDERQNVETGTVSDPVEQITHSNRSIFLRLLDEVDRTVTSQ